MTQLDRLVYRVHRADSLLADSLATLADSLARGAEVAAGDSVVGAPQDTMAIAMGEAPRPDSLLVEDSDRAEPGTVAPEMEGAGSPPAGGRIVGSLEGITAGSDTEGKSPDWFFKKGDSSTGESPARNGGNFRGPFRDRRTLPRPFGTAGLFTSLLPGGCPPLSQLGSVATHTLQHGLGSHGDEGGPGSGQALPGASDRGVLRLRPRQRRPQLSGVGGMADRRRESRSPIR